MRPWERPKFRQDKVSTGVTYLDRKGRERTLDPGMYSWTQVTPGEMKLRALYRGDELYGRSILMWLEKGGVALNILPSLQEVRAFLEFIGTQPDKASWALILPWQEATPQTRQTWLRIVQYPPPEAAFPEEPFEGVGPPSDDEIAPEDY